MEIWKDVKGYKGLYQVSSLGNIKSLNRSIKDSRGYERFINERMLSPSTNNGGYLSVVLSFKGKLTTKPIHILVAESFLNHITCGKKYVINHKDFDRKNNKKDNLEIVTFRTNTNKKHLKSSSKYTGVYWMKKNKKWMASIRMNNKNNYLGSFHNEFYAHLAYEKALKKLLQNEV